MQSNRVRTACRGHSPVARGRRATLQRRNCESRRTSRRVLAQRTGEAGAAQAVRVAKLAPRSTLRSAEAWQRYRATVRGRNRVRPEGARRPLPDIAEAEAPARALVRGRFPLDLARQPRPAQRHQASASKALTWTAGSAPATRLSWPSGAAARLAHLVDVARRAPRLALDPGPAGLAPVGLFVVAAVRRIRRTATRSPPGRRSRTRGSTPVRCASLSKVKPARRRPAASASPEGCGPRARTSRPAAPGRRAPARPGSARAPAKSSRRISS